MSMVLGRPLGRLRREGSEGKVLRIDRPDGRRVLKFDGLSGRGLRIALRAMLMKSALRDLLFCVIRYDRNSADWLAALATPYPGCAGLPPVQGEE